jgi:hypothetical protein
MINLEKFTQMGIKSEIERIEREIEDLQNERKNIREMCGHPNAKRVSKARDGRNWYEFRCPDCLDEWTRDL